MDALVDANAWYICIYNFLSKWALLMQIVNGFVSVLIMNGWLMTKFDLEWLEFE
jgi:hypothetical protein